MNSDSSTDICTAPGVKQTASGSLLQIEGSSARCAVTT